jgi:hypothetical protein
MYYAFRKVRYLFRIMYSDIRKGKHHLGHLDVKGSNPVLMDLAERVPIICTDLFDCVFPFQL